MEGAGPPTYAEPQSLKTTAVSFCRDTSWSEGDERDTRRAGGEQSSPGEPHSGRRKCRNEGENKTPLPLASLFLCSPSSSSALSLRCVIRVNHTARIPVTANIASHFVSRNEPLAKNWRPGLWAPPARQPAARASLNAASERSNRRTIEQSDLLRRCFTCSSGGPLLNDSVPLGVSLPPRPCTRLHIRTEAPRRLSHVNTRRPLGAGLGRGPRSPSPLERKQ
ncbi:hypothetical protein EYF80_049061 [Liparis tanakae]|uniref:Uncharacterized protein n=1 Tax=Liparis tanakae TaxID=230148 RepID=A0A4Z2FHQ3_9TELE|nr:hypothetical protein EYF80_049061 [Liparis tanakae]